MKKNDKHKALLMAAVGVLVIAGLFMYGFWSFKEGHLLGSFGSAVIAVILVAFLVPAVINRHKSIKKGFPIEDERSYKVKVIAGYKTFLISIYWLLFLSFMNDKFQLEGHSLVGLGILGMSLIFGAAWLYYNNKPELPI